MKHAPLRWLGEWWIGWALCLPALTFMLGLALGKTLHRQAQGVLPVTVLSGPASEWTGRRPGGGTLRGQLLRDAEGDYYFLIDTLPDGRE